MDKGLISIDITNKQKLEALARTTELQNKKITYDKKNNSFRPYLERGNIVLCDFVGFGKELDMAHYAVVWISHGWNENINIIPLTSKFKVESKGTFCLGKIKNFMSKDGQTFCNKESYIYLNRLMEVSRLRVRLIYQEDIKGNKITDINGNPIPVKVDDNMIDTISKSIMLNYSNQGICLVDLLLKSKPDNFLDLNSLSDQMILDVGYRMIDSYKEYLFPNDCILVFFINGKKYSIKRKKIRWERYLSEEHKNLYSEIRYHKNFGSRKRYIMEALFSRDITKVNEAKNIIADIS